jgi:hypothetical protein
MFPCANRLQRASSAFVRDGSLLLSPPCETRADSIEALYCLVSVLGFIVDDEQMRFARQTRQVRRFMSGRRRSQRWEVAGSVFSPHRAQLPRRAKGLPACWLDYSGQFDVKRRAERPSSHG